VDDDFAVRGLLAIAFERVGINTDVAENGREAIELLTRNAERYCSLVLDLDLPEFNGIELARYVTNNHPSLPIIIVSGRHDLSMRLHDAFNDSVKLVISKPIEPATVADVVHSQCLRLTQ
jgi:two-component system response regulator YesN